MKNLYKVENGEVSEVSAIEAQEICKREDFGQEVVLVDCETPEQALELATQHDAGKIGIDNISGQEAIDYGLVGLSA